MFSTFCVAYLAGSALNIYFLNNFCVVYPIATKFSVIICALLDIVFIEDELYRFKVMLGMRFLLICGGQKGREGFLKLTYSACIYYTY